MWWRGSADPLVLSPTFTLTRFAEIVAADLAEKEKKFGFPLDQEDKDTFELMLRNKYCGPQGLSSGWGHTRGGRMPYEASGRGQGQLIHGTKPV